MSYFTELGLAEPILRALDTKGYSDPTPIQRKAIPSLLEGRDLLGIAQTGTGKTAAFSLPSIHRLAASAKPRKNASCRMLVLSPTRELAAQIAENMRGYAKYLSLNVQCIFGGVPVGKQARALVPGCDILVATPGRLLDLIDQRALTLRDVEIFVLDEADQMMDLGFIVPLKRVAKLLPADRQSLFFSATMPNAIADLGKQFINNPVRVEVAPQSTTAERVEQYATFLNQAEKQALLTLRLRAGFADGSIDRALVFTRTKHGADRVVKHLITAGVQSAAIHGNKSQGQRTAAIKGFRSGEVPVLVATDIAARGIDIPGVSHVFNFEMPNVPEQYVHRIGRTARAGADGISMSFVAPDERPYLKDIEKLTRVKLDVLPLPEDFSKQASRLPLPSRKALPTEQPAGARDPQGRRNGSGRGGLPQRREDRRASADQLRHIEDPRQGMRSGAGERQERRPSAHDRAIRVETDAVRPTHAAHGERRGGEGRPGRTDQPRRAEHGGRGDQPRRAEHGGRADQPRRADHGGRTDQPRRGEHGGRGDQPRRADNGGRGDQPQRGNAPHGAKGPGDRRGGDTRQGQRPGQGGGRPGGQHQVRRREGGPRQG